jgi:hypothetical protein
VCSPSGLFGALFAVGTLSKLAARATQKFELR